jgi:16S rRNA (guanine527-N7)-methyltransferase
MGKPPAPLIEVETIGKLLHAVLSSLGLELNPRQQEQLATHFMLLLKWNEKINLTSIRTPEQIALRHFGESLFLAKLLSAPRGLMMDVGSGAGFPGLPLKMVWPNAATVLLEPNHKKATFLKEVVRSCGLTGVEVRAERLENVARAGLAGRAALVTMRAVAPAPAMIQELKKLLLPQGQIALFIGEDAAAQLRRNRELHWENPVAQPRSERRVVLLASLPADS